MGSDYIKKKNAELEELLKSRLLPHTGKKAELIARLQEYDARQSSAAKPSTTTAAAGDEDQIDWDDDVPPPSAPVGGSTPSGAAAIAAGGQGQVANPTAVPNQTVDTDPSKTDDLTADPPAAVSDNPPEDDAEGSAAQAKGAPAPPTDFTSGLQSSNVDDEIAKRQKRAARFGIQEDSTDALKALERAKKFGTGSESDRSAVKGLDEALPERAKKERGVKRGREESKDTRPASKRRENGKREDGRPVRNTRSGSRPQKGKGTQLNEKDKAAADARKERFATTP